MRWRTILVLAGLAACAAPLAACGSDGKDGGTLVRLSVIDAILRQPGKPCSGGGGYLYIHEGAPYRIVDPASGAVVARGTLPTGESVRIARPIQGAAVEPTLCGLTFRVKLPERARYELRLSQGKPIPFTRRDTRDGTVLLRIP